MRRLSEPLVIDHTTGHTVAWTIGGHAPVTSTREDIRLASVAVEQTGEVLLCGLWLNESDIDALSAAMTRARIGVAGGHACVPQADEDTLRCPDCERLSGGAS